MHQTTSHQRQRIVHHLKHAPFAALLLAVLLTLMPISLALAAPANDNLAGATSVGSLAAPFSQLNLDTTTATREAGEVGGLVGGCNFPPAGNTRSVWFKFSAAANGWVNAYTKGTNYDTVLEVFSGPAASPTYATLTSVACNDDAGTPVGPSDVSYPVLAGTTYYMVVRSYNALTPPANDLDFSASFAPNRQVYVNQTTGVGSDANTGSQAFPVKTLQRGVDVAQFAPDAIVNIVSANGSYNELVDIRSRLALKATQSAVAVNRFTLKNGADVTLASGSLAVSAPLVQVEAGAFVQQGVTLASTGATLTVGTSASPGSFAENVTIAKSLTLSGPADATSQTELPTLNPLSGSAFTITAGTVTLRRFNLAAAVSITGGSNHVLATNNFLGSTGLDTSVAVSAKDNYWNDAAGPPAPYGAGAGAAITGAGATSATARPWCTTPAPTCAPRAGAATRLVFSTSPGNTQAGSVFASQPVVEAQDDTGTVDASFTGSVSLVIKTGTGTSGAVLGGTTSLSFVNGIASFSGLKIDRVGQAYVLRATSASLSGESTSFNITADRLVVTASPADPSTAGAALSLTVAARDSFGTLDTTFSANVGLAIKPGSGTAGAVLNGTTSVAALNGVATFAPAENLNITLAGLDYILTASTAGLSSADSSAFDITAATASKLVVITSPSDPSSAGAALSVAVEARDSFDNRVTSYTGSISLAIKPGSGSAGATLNGTSSKAATGGVASFGAPENLNITRAGLDYILTASASGLTTGESSAFDIVPAAASKLVVTASPNDPSTAGGLLNVVVAAQDSFGNSATSFAGTVSLAIKAGTGSSGASLNGTTSKAATSGVASFGAPENLNITLAGADYILTASAASLTSATSNAFDIVAGAATKLAVTVSPADPSTAGTRLGLVVAAQDAFGNTDTTFTGTVDVAIKPGSGTAGATLNGTTSKAASAGVAAFSSTENMNITVAGTDYVLAVTAAGLSAAESTPFDILAGPASKLAVTTSPSDPSSAGAVLSVVVEARDSFDNRVAGYNGTISLAIKAGSGSAGATLNGTTSKAATGGVASFGAPENLNITLAGAGYIVTASGPGQTSADSNAFDIVAAAATTLVFSTSPGDSTAGVAFATQPVVEARDAFGNRDTSFNGNVTLAITSGTGASGATLAGTVTVAAANGVATFSGLSINKAASGYKLTATALGLSSADSTAFTISAGAASTLAFSQQPSDSTGGVAFPTQPKVEAQDAFGNTVASFNGAVTLAIKPGTGAVGAVIIGTLSVNAVNGVASFSGLAIDRVGSDYQLSASATALSSADSTAFDITTGPPSSLLFSISPSNSQAGVAFPTQPAVTLSDAGGNPIDGVAVTLAIKNGTGSAGATLAGTITVNTVSGTASFSGLAINKAGTGYQLTASSGAITADSATFDITVGAATRLVFTTSPGDSTAGVAFATQPVVEAHDSFGNRDTSFNSAVTVAITSGTGTAGATLSGVVTVNAVNGVATFSGLSIDKSGTGYQLTATSGALTSADSTSFTINPGPATQLAFTQQPANSTGGVAFPTQPVVELRDSFGNRATGAANPVTLAIKAGTGTAGAALSGTVTVTPAGGVASFSGLAINLVGSSYQLSASASGLSATDSTTFDISAGPATSLVFTSQPGNSQAGVALPTQPVLEARDAGGNLATGFSANVSLAIKSGTGAAGATLSGTTTVAATGGVASFSGLAINKAASGYKLSASAASLPVSDSTSFTIAAGAPTQLAFTSQPGNAQAGVAFSAQPVVRILDAFGNLTSSTAQVTLAIKPGTGTAGAALNGTATINAVGGVATFSGLSINLVGINYQLTASSASLTAADSAAFDITASGLVFSTQPSNGQAGIVLPTQPVVRAQDAAGNVDTTFNGAVTLAIKAGSGTAGAALGGTITVNAVNGVASFTDLTVNRVGTGYIITADAASLPTADSSTFAISAGPASKLVFSTSPVASPAGAPLAPQPVVTVQDALGNTASFSGPVSVAIKAGSGAPGALLGGTLTVNAVNGVASFSGLTINRTGAAYVLRATSGSLTAAETPAFNITGTRLVLSQAPGTTAVGRAFASQPVVRLTDNLGNLDTTFTGAIDLSIKPGTGTSGASITGQRSINAVNGIASFSGLAIDRVGSGYVLVASAASFTSAESGPFAITIAAAYLPLVRSPAYPDLVGSFTLSSNTLKYDQPVTVTVTITNRGNAATSGFWVDFYINPSSPPSGPNQPWEKRCGLKPCYGIAWYVAQTLNPGQSITLSSTADSYYGKNTRWPGAFVKGTSNLHLYVDSFNCNTDLSQCVPYGAVQESNEANNSAALVLPKPLASQPAGAPVSGPAPALPARPARP